jgi:hypothetical protein
VTTSYYIYYRLHPQTLAAAREQVAALLRAVEARCGVPGRVLRKRDEPALWMEIYDGVRDAAGFEVAMLEEVARLGFESLLAPGSARRIERFVSLPECV